MENRGTYEVIEHEGSYYIIPDYASAAAKSQFERHDKWALLMNADLAVDSNGKLIKSRWSRV